MQKKNVWLIVACVVIAVAFIAIGVFLFLTRDLEGREVSIEGTWYLVSHNSDPTNDASVPQYLENQYLVFKDGKINYYVNGESKLTGDYVYADSKIKISNMQTEIDQFPSELRTEIVASSDDFIKLIDDAKIRDWKMIRCAANDTQVAPVSDELLAGKWNVLVHGNSASGGETLEFDTAAKILHAHISSGDVDITYTRDTDNQLNVDKGFGRVLLLPVAENKIALVQLDDHCYVWILEKAK